jgi:hypothetical protein
VRRLTNGRFHSCRHARRAKTLATPLAIALYGALLWAAAPTAAQTPTPTPWPAPNCDGFEYKQIPMNFQWAAPRGGDQQFGVTAEEGIVNGAGALVALTGESITRVRVWGFSFDYDNFPNTAHSFCGTDRNTPWNLTFRGASADPQIPGAIIATRQVVASSGGPTSAGFRFAAPTPTPGPCTAIGPGNPAGCPGAAQWTLDFPPVPAADVRWIGVQLQTGANAPDGHPCAFAILTEGDPTTYDDEYYERGGIVQNVNRDLQICVGTTSLASLDIDGNGSVEPLVDGLLVLRRKFGFADATLVTGAVVVGGGCTRCFPDTIEAYIDAFTELDVDKNMAVEPLTDALMILRYLFGFRGPTLIANALGDGCTECTAPLIEANIAALLQ